ncbi:uncharacterized protein CC84DRAFT_1159045 [Paraphaeosphaeria sporulosa]|uniref:Uncharacterized protein n=1 Tax=Paraphaeosphaeria sporulosa TaxID=1460663 RepID=A0A177CWC2_9PLEO|nr:uncharacterized protein CC84DRAFT_1159045 [Paraphaeosphaeria sporulosa]OAG11526.1 hypothetical protein CC84DRAFT_1159045 [Paraphaeosphaeria sporulosa]
MHNLKRAFKSKPMTESLNRATWIWRSEEVIGSDDQIDQFVAFARKNGIKRVYIHINPDIPPQTLANFVGKCSPAGIAVEALMGDAAWIFDPKSHESLQIRLHWVAEYQNQYASEAQILLQGLHLDIEPWQLDGWRNAEQPELIRQWLGCFHYLKSWAQTQQPPLPVAADLPFWLHTLQYPDNNERLDVTIMAILDGAAFMTYRNDPQGLMDVAGEALWACSKCGKRREGIYLGVETVPSKEGQHISYHGLGIRKLQGDLGFLEGGYWLRKREPHEKHFAGLAVHDYHTWSKMYD